MNKKLHFNKPQLRSMLIGAPTEILIAGRGTGKTVGVLAPKTSNVYLRTMPRSKGFAVGATYNQLLTRTLPELIGGWQRLGYQNGVHFIVGKRPPAQWMKTWNWKGPYALPLDFRYFISWYNGAGVQMISQDGIGTSNGVSFDWGFGDEAKLLNEEKLKRELLPANRGLIPEFASNPYHHGITFTSDMPTGTAGAWLLENAEKVDHTVLNQIWEVQTAIFKLKHLFSQATGGIKKEIGKQIQVLNDELSDLRRGFLYYHEASALDNIHALGMEYILNQLRDTSTFEFDTQILNIRPMRLENGFYPDFDEEYHGYFASDHTYLDSLGFDLSKISAIDCRRDADLDLNQPLHIAIDYNRRIHPMTIGQLPAGEIRILKGLHSLYPGKLDEVLDLFIDYYRPHKRRLLYYWYDHTAVGDQHRTRICDDVVSRLSKAGWSVKRMYTGQAPTHESKYRMYGKLLQEPNEFGRVLRLNRENCSNLITSVNRAGVTKGKNGFEKDKSTEHDEKFPAEDSTHYSDSMDMLIDGALNSGLSLTYEEGGYGSTIL